MLKGFKRSDRYDNDRPKTLQLRPRVLTSNESSGIPPNAGEDCGCRKCFPGRPVKETDSFKDTCGCYNPTRRGFHWKLIIKKANGDRVYWDASGGVHEYVYSGDGVWKTKTFEGIDCEEEGATPNVYRYVLNAIDKTVTLELVEDNDCPIVTLTFCMVSVCGFKCTCPWTFEVDTFENAEAPEYCRLCITPIPASRVPSICTTGCRLTPFMHVTIPAFNAGTDGTDAYVSAMLALEPGAPPGLSYEDWDSDGNIMPEFVPNDDAAFRAVEEEVVKFYVPQIAVADDPIFYSYSLFDDGGVFAAGLFFGISVRLECTSVDSVTSVQCTITLSMMYYRPTASPLTPLKRVVSQYRVTAPVTEFCQNPQTATLLGTACSNFPADGNTDCDGATPPDTVYIRFVDPPPATTSGHVGTARCGDLDNCLAEECVLEVEEYQGVKRWKVSEDATCSVGCGNYCLPAPTCNASVHPVCGDAADFSVGYKCTQPCSIEPEAGSRATVTLSGCECGSTSATLCINLGTGHMEGSTTICGDVFTFDYYESLGTWYLYADIPGTGLVFGSSASPAGPFLIEYSGCEGLTATVSAT